MAALESSASRGGGAGCRAALRALPEAWRRSELLWEALFASPCEWWDFRRGKTSRGHPDFRHKASRDSLWLDNQYKPAWVDPRLPTLEHLTTPAPCAALLCDEFYTLLGQGHLDKALHLLPRMDQLHMAPSQGMYMSLLKACNRSRALPQAKLIHSHISSRRLQLTGLLGDFLVVTLAKCGALEDACQLFQTLPCGTVFSWTAMISGYVDCGKDKEALKMYSFMLEEGVEPDRCTFVSLFKACGNILDLGEGKRLHAEAQSKGFISDIFVASSLVSMYGKCGDIVQAEVVFDGMCQRDVVAWSGMLSAYIDEGQGNKALRLYRQMHEEGMRLYRLPFVSAVQACGILAEEEKASVMQGTSAKAKSLEIAQALHADARREGITSDVFVGSTLVSFYGKLGAIVEAEIACDGLSERDVVAWSAMLSAYVEQGQGDKALQLYRHMQHEGVRPNKLTFVFALQACGILADKEEAFTVEGCSIKVVSLEIGQALHVDCERKGFASDIVVGSMLVSMYGKCGAVVEAEIAFNELSERDTVSWTAMLSAYVNEGLGDKALQFYTQMQKEHITLTDITLVSVLQACSGSGSLEIVRQLHFSTVSSWYDVSRLLVNTLVYAYGTCASMVEAQAVFDGLPQPDVVTWSACIAGYSQEGNCALCLKMFRKMQLAGIKPDGVTFLSLLSAFRHAGLVHEAVDNFESMRRDYGLIPALKHYAVMIDLLGRAGNLKGVEKILRGMPKQADLSILLGLLGACRTHGNLEMGKQAFGHAVHLQPMEATAYVLMSNLYADAGMQDGANEVEKLRQGEGA